LLIHVQTLNYCKESKNKLSFHKSPNPLTVAEQQQQKVRCYSSRRRSDFLMICPELPLVIGSEKGIEKEYFQSKRRCLGVYQRQSGVGSPSVTGALSLSFHSPFLALCKQSEHMQYLLRYFHCFEPLQFFSS
jgi:hypothetical protein